MKIEAADCGDDSYDKVREILKEQEMSEGLSNARIIATSLNFLKNHDSFNIDEKIKSKCEWAICAPVPIYSKKKGTTVRQYDIVKSLDVATPGLCEFRCKLSQFEFRSIAFVYSDENSEYMLLTYTFLKEKLDNGHSPTDSHGQSKTRKYMKLAKDNFEDNVKNYFEVDDGNEEN